MAQSPQTPQSVQHFYPPNGWAVREVQSWYKYKDNFGFYCTLEGRNSGTS